MQSPVTVQPVQVPPPPAPPAPPAIPELAQTSNARAVFLAKQQQREVLGDQMSRLLRRRENVSSQLKDPSISATEKAALEEHYNTLNQRIIDMERQLQLADGEWSAAAGVPGAVAQPRSIRQDGPPEEMFIIGSSLTGIAVVILAIAWARRLMKGGGKVIAQIPAAFEQRFTRLEQSLDAVAIEVERVSEGQRFLTRVFAEQNPRAVGAGAAQPVESRGADRVESYRGG